MSSRSDDLPHRTLSPHGEPNAGTIQGLNEESLRCTRSRLFSRRRLQSALIPRARKICHYKLSETKEGKKLIDERTLEAESQRSYIYV